MIVPPEQPPIKTKKDFIIRVVIPFTIAGTLAYFLITEALRSLP